MSLGHLDRFPSKKPVSLSVVWVFVFLVDLEGQTSLSKMNSGLLVVHLRYDILHVCDGGLFGRYFQQSALINDEEYELPDTGNIRTFGLSFHKPSSYNPYDIDQLIDI